jgi:uncharacterized membrane protein YgaE (UPF0421/DUF939 family)
MTLPREGTRVNPIGWGRAALGRLRQEWIPLAESTAAATAAWFVATRLVGHPQPYFAPAAALIVLGQARGERMRRALEVVLGVAGGVLVAEVVVEALGRQTVWSVCAVILLTLSFAVMIGASRIFLVQAALSALYLVVVPPPAHSILPVRFIDALVGGGIAIIVNQVVVARDPVAPLVRDSRQVFDALAGVLGDVAAALERRDETAAMAALARARQVDATVDQLRTAVSAAGEALRLHFRRRQRLGGVRAVDAATHQVDYAVRNIRVLARAGVTLLRLPVAPPPELIRAVRSLAVAVSAVDASLAAELTESGQTARDHAARAEEAALDAVRMAGSLLVDAPPLPLVMIVGQLRATAIDLLRGTGADDIEVLSLVDEAMGLPPL